MMIDINSQKGIMAHLTVTQRTQLLAINVSGTNEPTYSQLGSLALDVRHVTDESGDVGRLTIKGLLGQDAVQAA